jgi:phage tail sheath gpL-like
MITFNNIPDTIRTPGMYTEIDNSRALKGLFPNPHKALLIGQKTSSGSKPSEVLYQITSDGLADGFFGAGSQLAIMCNAFKQNNPNTELYAVALSDAGAAVAASGVIRFSVALSATGFSLVGNGTYNLLIDGIKVPVVLTSGWSAADINSAAIDKITATDQLPVTGSTNATSALCIIAKNAGSQGNFIDIRANYYTGKEDPSGFGDSAPITAMANGATDPSVSGVWAIAADIQFHYVGMPYDGATNIASLETELADRFGPLVNLQGQGFVGVRKSLADASTLGNSRNSAHNCIMAAYGSPSGPARWTAALCAVAAYNLNQDPARPLHYLPLKGILAPTEADRFMRSERDILLYDGIATYLVDSGGNVCIERCITTYQTNAAGVLDPSYLDVQTLATLSEIRYQYKARMLTRFIVPRFKLVSDTFPVQPGTNVVQPKTIKDEIIALFTMLRDKGLIENLDDFKTNLIVERSTTDQNRVDVLLPPDLVNQFMMLGSIIQFIL